MKAAADRLAHHANALRRNADNILLVNPLAMAEDIDMVVDELWRLAGKLVR